MRRLIYTVCIATTIAMAAPVVQSFANADGPSAEQQAQWRQAREQRLQQRAELLDARLVGLKASLALTSDQDKNWSPFEAALRAAAKPRISPVGQGGGDARNEPRPSPIDMMRRISTRMSERSTELSALADAATPLYASFDDKQKLVFRATLRELLHRPRFGFDPPSPGRFDRRG
jgi:hypothetical protein